MLLPLVLCPKKLIPTVSAYRSKVMSLLCRPSSRTTQISFFFKADPDSISEVIDVESEDIFLCTERDGLWILCYSRRISGWVESIYLDPIVLPTAFMVNDELPSEAQIRLRTKPSDDESAVGLERTAPGSILLIIEINGVWLKVLHNGKEAWLKRMANHDVILAVPVIPKIFEKGPALPAGCSLRLRTAPEEDAPISQLSENSYYSCIQSKGNWIQVLCCPRPQKPTCEWMLRKTADGTILLQESKKRIRLMCMEESLPQEATIRIRESCDASAAEVDFITYWDAVPVIGTEGVWAQVYSDAWAGYVLTTSGQKKFLQPFTPVYPKAGIFWSFIFCVSSSPVSYLLSPVLVILGTKKGAAPPSRPPGKSDGISNVIANATDLIRFDLIAIQLYDLICF